MKKDSVVLEELDKVEVNYDNRCKIILSHPVIFAYFIKHCFVDFVNVDFNEIVRACEKYLLITGKEDNLISGSKVIYDVYAHYLDGVMNRISNKEESLGKEYHFPNESYDDRETVLLYPKKEYDYEGNLGNDFEHALAFANLLFSDDIPVSKKKYYLKKRFKIPMNYEFEKEIDNMCNLAFQQSCIKYKASLEALMNKTSWPLDEAMDAIAIPERYRPILYERFAEEEAYYKEHKGCSN
ncbi:MAG: hypothetical protein LUG60_03180 [Erysipelotrichaceae bacterium]|nr:hypothetical protein [Erysipelotrichaceae bacterium]